jgi:hypothetical protein
MSDTARASLPVGKSSPWPMPGQSELRDCGHPITRPIDALDFLGRCLSYGDSASSRARLEKTLRAGEIDWLLVIGLSNQARLTAALDIGLQHKALSELLPPDLRSYLAMIRDVNRQRNRRIRWEATELFAAWNRCGIRPLLMKGGVSLFEADMDESLLMMADVDALVPEGEFPSACEVLHSLGYAALDDPPYRNHASTYCRPGELATIDLHRHIGPQLRLLTPVEAVRSAVALTAGSLDIAALCPTHRVLLLLMIYCVFEPQYRGGEIPLKGLHDLAIICRHHRANIDWEAISRVVHRHSLEAPSQAWFHMANLLLEVPIPRQLHDAAAAGRHLNRCLRQVRHPALARAYGRWAGLTWPFDRFRMDYRYDCGVAGRRLAAARVHHAAVLARRFRTVPGRADHQLGWS